MFITMFVILGLSYAAGAAYFYFLFHTNKSYNKIAPLLALTWPISVAPAILLEK